MLSRAEGRKKVSGLSKAAAACLGGRLTGGPCACEVHRAVTSPLQLPLPEVPRRARCLIRSANVGTPGFPRWTKHGRGE